MMGKKERQTNDGEVQEIGEDGEEQDTGERWRRAGDGQVISKCEGQAGETRRVVG